MPALGVTEALVNNGFCSQLAGIFVKLNEQRLAIGHVCVFVGELGHRGGIHRVGWGGTASFVNSTPSTGGSRWI